MVVVVDRYNALSNCPPSLWLLPGIGGPHRNAGGIFPRRTYTYHGSPGTDPADPRDACRLDLDL